MKPVRPRALDRLLLGLIAAMAISLGLAACGGGDNGSDSTSGGGAGGLTVTADESGQLSWDPTELTAPAGEVTITLDNPAPVAHDIKIEGNGVEEGSDLVTDDTTEVTAQLDPGEYSYICTVPGHEDAGMSGTLTVE